MSKPCVAQIQRATARSFGVNLERMLGYGRDPHFAIPRLMSMYLARELTGYSYPRLGRLFGRDHTTIMYAVKTTRQRIQDDRYLAGKAALLADLLTANPLAVNEFTGTSRLIPHRESIDCPMEDKAFEAAA